MTLWLIMAGHMGLAVAGTAVIAVRSGSASLGALVMNINQLHEESLYVQDHDRFLAGAARRSIPNDGEDPPERVGQVVLDKVSYRHPERGDPALDGVSVTLPMGSVTAVVGENGSGKSTLMKVLAGLLLPQSGTVHWGPAELSVLDRSQVFDRVALLTQDFQRWPVTRRAQHPHRAPRPARRKPGPAALGRLRGSRPAPRETPPRPGQSAGPCVPWGLRTLRWRMAEDGLARTHWRTASGRADSVLIVDEPTSALDPEAEIAAFDAVRRLAGPDRAVVLVTHRVSGVREADMIYVLDRGRLVEHGSHHELMAARGRYAAMFTTQAAQYAPEPRGAVPRPGGPAGHPTER
ncbi:ATP-binding cassette domain-containing protein [Streptomyces sp. NPDC057428]|uniref:ATP-binding cassette domain-containing protein n=1 Tax=Streptomyces sp. NPDC057428 TaxID=3346129 RepID=UPI0036B7EBC2